MAPRKVTVPDQSVPVDTNGGSVNPTWYEKLKYLETLQPLSDLPPQPSYSITGVTVGSGTAVSVSGGVSKGASTTPGGSNLSTLNYNSGAVGAVFVQNAVDALVTTASGLTLAQGNDNTLASEVSALKTRVTTLETKLNAVIADLATRFP